jgi:putative spermidine/putrescine transport system substrate-binding protein
MMKVSVISCISGSAFAIGLATAPASADQVTFVSQGGAYQEAQTKAILDPAAKNLAITVNQESSPDAWPVIKTQGATGKPTWDVVDTPTEDCVRGGNQNLIEKLDFSAIPNAAKMPAAYKTPYSVAYEFYSSVLAYNKGKFGGAPPQSWADFWDVKKFPGKRGMRKTPKYALEAALMADGVKPDQVYKVMSTPAGIDRAFKKLDELKPNILWWASVAQVPDLLASGEVAMSMATPGRLLLADRQEHRNFRPVWDGNIYAVDFWAVLKNSPHKTDALKLVKYMSDADHEMNLPRYMPAGLSNKEAIARIDPALTRETPSNPDNMKNALALDPEFWVENNDQLTQRFNAWAAR